MNEPDFIQHYIANTSQIMWFLGAGTSRTAGLPTATDIIGDLKVNYYSEELDSLMPASIMHGVIL